MRPSGVQRHGARQLTSSSHGRARLSAARRHPPCESSAMLCRLREAWSVYRSEPAPLKGRYPLRRRLHGPSSSATSASTKCPSITMFHLVSARTACGNMCCNCAGPQTTMSAPSQRRKFGHEGYVRQRRCKTASITAPASGRTCAKQDRPSAHTSAPTVCRGLPHGHSSHRQAMAASGQWYIRRGEAHRHSAQQL